MADHDVEDREVGPTYKSLFIGACGLISLSFGWWFTDFISAVNTLTSRVAALEVRDTETRWTFKINASKIDSHEERLRELEREHDQHRSGKPVKEKP
mgnify:CR=1 FL=1